MSLNIDYHDAEKILLGKEISAKSALAFKLNQIISLRGLSQNEVAEITNMTQPKVSQICRYKLQNISLERLMHALVDLNHNVEIVVRTANEMNSASITVNTE
jgi:predicted XRE-type DNA-binding protein